MKKEDRRVKKTEKALAEALSKLLVDKKIQNITIRERHFINIIRISMIFMKS